MLSTFHGGRWIVDEVYVLICISSLHWVAYTIHFRRCRSMVYDSCLTTHFALSLIKVMCLMSELIPYLLDDIRFYKIKIELKFSKDTFMLLCSVDGVCL